MRVSLLTVATSAVAKETLTRSWLSEASGYLVLTPQGGGAVLRVPYYAAPTPASAMATTAPLGTTGAVGLSDLTLAGTGVDTLALAVAPQQGVLSLVTPFELSYASPKAAPVGGQLPIGYAQAETDLANLRYVGVTSNVTDLGGDPASAELYFGITTWGRWGTPSDVEFDIYLRQAGAPGRRQSALRQVRVSKVSQEAPRPEQSALLVQPTQAPLAASQTGVAGLVAQSAFTVQESPATWTTSARSPAALWWCSSISEPTWVARARPRS